jgi:hypothetical protein
MVVVTLLKSEDALKSRAIDAAVADKLQFTHNVHLNCKQWDSAEDTQVHPQVHHPCTLFCATFFLSLSKLSPVAPVPFTLKLQKIMKISFVHTNGKKECSSYEDCVAVVTFLQWNLLSFQPQKRS